MSTIVFLGGGRITSAMLAGLRRAEKNCQGGHPRMHPSQYRFVVHDRNPGKLRALRKEYEVETDSDLGSAVRRADILILAVRPSSVTEVLSAIEKVNRPLLAISLAAGVPLRVLTKALGAPVRWARAMPSPVCRSGCGLTALTFPRSLSPRHRKQVRDLFATFGKVIEIPESRLDAFTVTYSCSHGYHALSTLAKAGQAAGLDRETALIASAHALADGIIAWREGKKTHSLESLLAEAATPGGIAATTTQAMDAAGYRLAVARGVRAGLRRARANARK